MEDQLSRDKFEKFTWTIKNFSTVNSEMMHSETFVIGGFPWQIFLFPNGKSVDGLSIYLDVVDSPKLPDGWERFAKFRLALINQVNRDKTIAEETQQKFDVKKSCWGYASSFQLRQLLDPRNGFLLNDTCIIEAEIFVPKNQVAQAVRTTTSQDSRDQMEVETLQQEDQKHNVTPLAPLSSQVSTESIEHTGNPSLTMEMSSNPMDTLIDFRGLWKIKATFAPLLEQVCSEYPSLIDCQKKRSPRFAEWAFTALGRVLYFLDSLKAKDMNDDTCTHLQILWEELETFKFDLTWLKDHVEFALGMKSYVERAVQVDKLRENVAAKEMEIQRVKAKLAAAEVDLEIAKRDLAKAEEGSEERDMDVELGYGMP